MDENVRNLIEVSRSEIKDHTYIKGIGRVNLRIQVDEQGGSSQKTVALVRDAGMMITSQLGNMRITPSQRMIRIPRNWMGFTAVVECLSQGGRSLLREAEGPRHDKISADNADTSERRRVSRALRELGQWVVVTIGEYAKPPEPTTADNATEIAQDLPLPGNGAQSEDPGRGEWEITEPQQSRTAPRGLRAPGRRRQTSGRGPGGGRSRPGTGRGNGKSRGRRRDRRNVPVEASFHDIRRLPTTQTQNPELTARFAFDRPQGPIKRIRLYAVGESWVRREAEPVLLQRAYIGGRRLKVKDGEVVNPPEELLNNDRVQIELKAIRPISDKRLEVRFIE